jgi:hypothetical protein
MRNKLFIIRGGLLMKSIRRLSLALIMFSLFSVSYLVTSVTAQTAVVPTGTAPTGTPGMPPTQGDPCMVVPAGPDRVACYATQTPSGGNHSQGDPCMVVPAGPDRVACYAAPTGMAPTGTSESGGISGWIKDGLKSLGIGSEPVVNPVGMPGSAGNAAAAKAPGDPCMVVPAGPDRVACYAAPRP